MNRNVIDPWSLAHVSWGVVLYYVQYAVVGKRVGWSAVVAVAVGVGWELIENNKWVQAKFRAMGFPDYYGDSKRNMVSDQVFMMFGFLLGWFGPSWFVLLPVLLEGVLYVMTRDSTISVLARAATRILRYTAVRIDRWWS